MLQQTSNTLIIVDTLLGEAALYHTANKTSEKKGKERQSEKAGDLVHFHSSEQ